MVKPGDGGKRLLQGGWRVGGVMGGALGLAEGGDGVWNRGSGHNQRRGNIRDLVGRGIIKDDDTVLSMMS